MPHAIGGGCLILEVQEPTDYTIRVEKKTPSGFIIDDIMCHQGLGFARMFECFEYEGMNQDEMKKVYCMTPQDVSGDYGKKYRLVGYENTPCFQMEVMEVLDSCKMEGDGTASCLYVLSGQGILRSKTQICDLARNDQFFIPADSGAYSISATEGMPVYLIMIKGPR